MALLKTLYKDKLCFHIFDTRAEGGKLAAADGAEVIRKLQAEKEWVNIIFAAAPSQNDTLAALPDLPTVDTSSSRRMNMTSSSGKSRLYCHS